MAITMNKKMLSSNNKLYLHYVICFMIMFGFGQLPPLEPLTPLGMSVLGVFFGAVYGWTFADMIIPSLMGIVGIAFLEGNNINQVVASGLGTQVVWFVILFMVFTNIIEAAGLTRYFASRIMSLKILSGRPWLLSFAFIFVAYFVGSINVFAAMFILWGILYGICETVGYKPYDPYPTIMIIGITLFAVFGLVLMPFQTNALIILTAFEAITHITIGFASYAAFMIPLIILCMFVFIFLAKLVFRIDASALKTADTSQISNVETLNLTQKIICAALVVAVILLLIPSMCPKEWLLTQFMNKIGLVGTIIFVLAPLMVIRMNDEPILSYEKMMARGIPWGAVFVTAFVLPLSPLLTAEATGVQQLFLNIIAPLNTLPPFLFLFVVFLITTILTNFANNTATALLMMPVILGYGEQAGIPLSALVVLLIACTHIAILTPAACPMSGTMFGNTGWIKGKDVYKYAPLIIICCFVVLFIGGYFWGQTLF